MSVPVPIDEISVIASDYGESAFVLVGTAEGPPRITHSMVSFDHGAIVVTVGSRGAKALAENPAVSVLWPATRDQSMSLIVDGVVDKVSAEGGPIRIAPSGAVLHRPATG